MPVVLTPAVDLTKVKMKWREVYVSEGLNKKLSPSQAPGIYRGFELEFDGTQGAGDRRVAVAPDSTTGDNAVVYQSQDGFSLTYFDPAASTLIFDLSDASLDSQETVITMFIEYQIGTDTTAEYRAYTVAEYNALTAGLRGELIVLGTIDVPAASTNITAGMIRRDRKTWAWEGLAKGAIPWTPLLRNPSFDWGSDATSDTGPGGIAEARYSHAFWETFATSGDISILRNSTDKHSGAWSMEVSFNSTGVASGYIRQGTMVPVVGGQLIRVKLWVDVVQISTAGTVELFWYYLPQAGGPPAEVTVEIDTSTVTSGFVLVDKVVEVSSLNLYALVSLGIKITGLNVAGTGPAIRFDDFQCWMETLDVTQRLQNMSQRAMEVSAYPLVFEDPDYQRYPGSPMLRYDWDTKQLIGQRLDRNDEDGSGEAPPILNWFGQLFLGQGLLASNADAETAKLSVEASTGTKTLIWESLPSGGTPGGIRVYSNASGSSTSMEITSNASWDNSVGWTKDDDTVASERIYIGGSGTFSVSYRAVGAGTWTSWENNLSVLSQTGTLGTTRTYGQAELGYGIRSAIADAVLPRLTMQAATSGNSEYTLFAELEPGTGSVFTRIYAKSDGELHLTRNAKWETGSTWTKDVDNYSAFDLYVTETATQNNPIVNLRTRALTSNGSWADGSWSYDPALNFDTAQDGAVTIDLANGSFNGRSVTCSYEPASTVSLSNLLAATNIVKCWGVVDAGEFVAPHVVAGFNITSLTDLGSTFQVNIGSDMVSGDYAVVGTFGPGLGDSGPTPLDSFIQVISQAAGNFELEAISHSGSQQTIAGGLDTRVFFMVVGEQ